MPELEIHALTLPTPFEVGALNAYLVPGDPPTLIDTGVRSDAAWEALERGLAAHGLGVADLGRVILTHGHVDHYGQASRIRERSGAEIVAHPRTVPIVADFPWNQEQVAANTIDFFTRHGAPREVAERALEQLTSGAVFQEPVGVDRTIQHGEELDLGGDRRFRVYEVGGHLPGHVVLYHEATLTLVTGDQLLADAPTVPFLYLVDWHRGRRPSSLNLYLTSLSHLARLEVERVLPAHGGFEVRHTERIAQIQRRYERVRRRMRSLLLEAGELSAFELAQRLYRGHAEATPFLVMSEVIGNVDFLDRSGEIEHVDGADGGFRLRLSRLGQRDDDADIPVRLRIDREGRWYHDGEEITHPRTLQMFVRSLVLEEDGRVVVRAGADRMAVEIEDAAHLVRGIDESNGTLRLNLGYGLSEVLDPDGLSVAEDHVPYARLESGLEARFSRAAYYQLARHIEEGPDGSFALVTTDGRRHPIRPRATPAGGDADA